EEGWALFSGNEPDNEQAGTPAYKRSVPLSPGGLLRLTAWPQLLDWGELADKLRAGELTDIPDVTFSELPEGVGLVYPLPAGFEPVTPPLQLGLALAALRHTPSAQPVDVFVGRAPSLTGTVTDATGAPVAGARVEAFPVLPPPATWAWTVFHAGACREAAGWELSAIIGERDPDVSIEESFRSQLAYFTGRPTGYVYPPEAPLFELKPESPHYNRGLRRYYATSTNERGEYSLPLLISGRWLLHVRHVYHPAAVQPVALHGGPNRCDVQMGTRSRGVLLVAVHQQEGGEPATKVRVEIRTSGPNGPIRGIEEQEESYIVKNDGHGNFTPLQVASIEPGFWQVTVSDGSNEHMYIVLIQAGATVTLDVPVGDKSLGCWRPSLRFGGRIVKKGAIYVLGGEWDEPTSVGVDWEDNNPPCFQLAAGDYIAWAPALPPLRFRIEPGRTRDDVLDMPAASITFSADATIFALLDGPDHAADPSLRLDLQSDEFWSNANLLTELAVTLNEETDGYNILRPGKDCTWWLPPGKYRWQLDGSNDYLSGHLSIAAGQTQHHLSLNNLPGLTVFELNYPDERDECPAEVKLALPESVSLEAVRLGSTGHFGPNITFADQEVNNIRVASERRWYFFARRGRYELTLRDQLEDGECELTRTVSLPGALTVRRADLSPARRLPTAALTFTEDAGDDSSYRIVAWLANGSVRELHTGSRNEVPVGAVTLWVVHSTFRAGEGGLLGRRSARVRVALGEKGMELDLSKLAYEATGTVTITCRGRGDPGAPVDPWWSELHYQGAALYALRPLHEDGLQSVSIWLPESDYISTAGGSPEFRYTNLSLPPGRYRAVPWQGAAEQYCREFTVKPGEHTSVVIEGGK
ncbi:MAG: carboxypeptidase regulatory-like domain-containing protein, partial [Planctomycetes bacterium]|nr:carboxypeptidase regulatory-like domain-containing protein [Planctomycetota bacterium]